MTRARARSPRVSFLVDVLISQQFAQEVLGWLKAHWPDDCRSDEVETQASGGRLGVGLVEKRVVHLSGWHTDTLDVW